MKESSNQFRFTPEGWHTVTPTILIADSMIMISDSGIRRPMPSFLYVYVENADETYRRALQAGASSVEEPSDLPYGDRRGMVEDPWGILGR